MRQSSWICLFIVLEIREYGRSFCVVYYRFVMVSYEYTNNVSILSTSSRSYRTTFHCNSEILCPRISFVRLPQIYGEQVMVRIEIRAAAVILNDQFVIPGVNYEFCVSSPY